MENPIFKFIWNYNGLQTAKAIFKKRNKVGGLTLTDFKTFNKAIVIKSMESLHKGGYRDKRNRIESLDINSHMYGQFIFNKGVKTIQWRKKTLFNRW